MVDEAREGSRKVLSEKYFNAHIKRPDGARVRFVERRKGE